MKSTLTVHLFSDPRRTRLAGTIAVFVILALSCYLYAIRRPNWADEYLSYHGVHFDSLKDVVACSADTMNAMPPLYFIFSWLAAQVVGFSIEAHRILAVSWALLGILLLFWELKPRYGTLPALLACAAITSTYQFMYFVTDFRLYGLWFFLCVAFFSLALRFLLLSCVGVFAAGFFLHMALVWLHYYGLFLSLIIFITLIFLKEPLNKRMSYAAGAALAGFSFAIWIPAFRNHLTMNKLYYMEFDKLLPFNLVIQVFPALVLLTFLLILHVVSARGNYLDVQARRARDDNRVRYASCSLIAMIVLMYCLGLTGQISAVRERYLFPMVLIPLAAGIAYVSKQLLLRPSGSWPAPILVVALLGLCYWNLRHGIGHNFNPWRQTQNQIAAQEDVATFQKGHGLPLVCAFFGEISEISYFQILDVHAPYYLVPDKIGDALSADNPSKYINLIQIGQALSRQSKTIPSLSPDQLVAKHRQVLVLYPDGGLPLWIRRYPHTAERLSIALRDGKSISIQLITFTNHRD